MRPDLVLRRLRRRFRRLVVKNLARAAMIVTRPTRLALVYGSPDFEENSLVTALGLSEVYRGETVLVCTQPERTRRYLQIAAETVGGDPAAIRLQRLDKWHVLRLFGRAELVFTTHGLFFSPPSSGRRLHVNLWHGTGPKSAANRNFASVFSADALSSASPVWGTDTARTLGTRKPLTVLPGNARADLLVTSTSIRARLGWTKQRPVVLWVPTYRRSATVSVGTLREGRSVRDEGVGIAAAAERHGIRLIIKPHPFDAEAFDGLGVETLDTPELWERGVAFGQALASSAAVISDYSSAWVDAMAAGIPVGLYCPDLDQYDRDRGFNSPPMADIAAGLLMWQPRDVDEFFAAAAAGTAFRPAAQQACAQALGLVPGPRSAALLRAVGALGRDRLGDDFGLDPQPRGRNPMGTLPDGQE